MIKKEKIAIIGLGYVGLPLAVEFGKKFETFAYDISEERIEELKKGHDKTFELTHKDLLSSRYISFTSRLNDLKDCNIYIICVPTPIKNDKSPDLSPIKSATLGISEIIKKGDIVIYESTVYPGLTEEFCVPIIEEVSGLKYNTDFFCGYSPERINPGDKEHKIGNIIKVTSGSDKLTLEKVDNLYKSIVPAGTYKASSIKVAEMAKVIENTQRDVNIALINEFSQICKKLEIDTEEVLKAAESKWNFISFRPGLVGGHCIGVDPYYLTYKCEQMGHEPNVILSGRRMNDDMHRFIADDLISMMKNKIIEKEEVQILIMGLTFKEDCPDFRNSGSLKLYNELESQGYKVDIYDPWVDVSTVQDQHKIKPILELQEGTYDAIIIATSHQDFKDMGHEKIKSFGKEHHLLYDMKYIFNANEVDARL